MFNTVNSMLLRVRINMLRVCTFWLILVSFSSCSSTEKTNITIIKGVNLFDGETLMENVTIAFEKDSILEISTGKGSYKGEIIDGKGKTIIPPLLNAHVHAWEVKKLKEAANAGVFGLLDMHNTDWAVKKMKSYRDSVGYAYFYSSGPGATVPEGHGTQFGIKVPTINETTSPTQFVEDRVKNQSDYIKILREPFRATINFQQTQEVITAAHGHSKLCVSHVSHLKDAMKLAEQGVDGFVHVWWDEEITEPQLDSLAGIDLFMVPTLVVIKGALESGWGKDPLPFDKVVNQVNEIYKKGIPILAGTDCPNLNLNCDSDLFSEMFLLSEAGMTNEDVLKAATSNVYKSFGLEEFGVLKKGSKASFVMIDGNPLATMDDIKKVEAIWQNGERIK